MNNEQIDNIEFQVEPDNAHVRAYSKMWLERCSNCNGIDVTEKYVRLEQPPWSRTEYSCIKCGATVKEKCWRAVLEEYGDNED